MSSRTEATIPVIDFSKQDLKPGSPEWDSVKLQVRKALEEYGCFEALLDQVVELRKPIIRAMEELFDLPLQTKKLFVSDKPFSGYTRSESGLLETMSTNDAHVAGNIERHLTTTLWPQGNKSFSETMVSFTELLSGLEKMVRRMILESFDIEKYIDEFVDSTDYQLRIMKYGSPETSEPTLSIRTHHDLDLITLLYQNEVNGLEVQNKDGEWIDINPSPNSVIVLIGEALSAWLNGGLYIPYHHVILKENKARYSIGLFPVPKAGYLMKVPEELVDEKNPLLFKPYDHSQFMEFYATQRAQGNVNYDIKAYCGV